MHRPHLCTSRGRISSGNSNRVSRPIGAPHCLHSGAFAINCSSRFFCAQQTHPTALLRIQRAMQRGLLLLEMHNARRHVCILSSRRILVEQGQGYNDWVREPVGCYSGGISCATPFKSFCDSSKACCCRQTHVYERARSIASRPSHFLTVRAVLHSSQ